MDVQMLLFSSNTLNVNVLFSTWKKSLRRATCWIMWIKHAKYWLYMINFLLDNIWHAHCTLKRDEWTRSKDIQLLTDRILKAQLPKLLLVWILYRKYWWYSCYSQMVNEPTLIHDSRALPYLFWKACLMSPKSISERLTTIRIKVLSLVPIPAIESCKRSAKKSTFDFTHLANQYQENV